MPRASKEKKVSSIGELLDKMLVQVVGDSIEIDGTFVIARIDNGNEKLGYVPLRNKDPRKIIYPHVMYAGELSLERWVGKNEFSAYKLSSIDGCFSTGFITKGSWHIVEKDPNDDENRKNPYPFLKASAPFISKEAEVRFYFPPNEDKYSF